MQPLTITATTAATEQKRLYDWWKNIRPNRPDPNVESGWNEFCDRRHAARASEEDDSWCMRFDDKTVEERAERKLMLDAIDTIEKRYDDEDETMIVALIKIRQRLWA